jgi:hypothetical protein
MNLKKLDKVWRETCPEEANGLVSKKKRKFFNKILERSANKKKLAELNKQEKEQK